MATFLHSGDESNQNSGLQIQTILNKLNHHQPLDDAEFFIWFHHTICQKKTRQDQAYRKPGP